LPSKCTRCGKIYEAGSKAILTGCECGNRLFFYFRKISDAEAEELKREKETKEIQEEIWNIRVKEGVYDIDVASLMSKEPIIVAGEEGRYLVSLSSAFEGSGKRTKYTKKLKKRQ
jgi:predicted  nucleic acid-binding Zn-ribbon protein